MGERCGWVTSDDIYIKYHDTEWGVPEYDSRALWEKLVLDGFQAGLSWLTILKKREAFRAAFADFDPIKVAKFD
ncbi:MAG: DNA-3-methyladenine glycosylase I, partial [Proteobacteria bacterium]|nr:DNA-3-methyladenine glycosylase I [Pseudomonadota bacterium]